MSSIDPGLVEVHEQIEDPPPSPLHDAPYAEHLSVHPTSESTRLETAKILWQQLLPGQQRTYTPPERSRASTLTTSNLRNNQHWGDTLEAKEINTTRLYSINVNGLSIDRRGGTFDELCRITKEIQADIVCVQEHNLDSTQHNIRTVLYDTVRKHWDRTKIAIGTTPITFESHYKPGGTLILTSGSVTGRVVKQVRDKWGRWVAQEFLGRECGRVVIFSVYQPVDKSDQAGRISVAAQHKALLLASNDPTSNPRVAFRRDLREAIKLYVDQQASVIILGDFNEQLGNDPDGMIRMVIDFGLVDVMSSRHSSTPPATYARGSNRLDYVLASPKVASAVLRAGYEPFNSRIPSDHRGYFVDFQTTSLFGSDTQELVACQRRGLSSSNVNQVTEYIRQKHQLLTDQNVFSRAAKLMLPGNRHALAEKLDTAVRSASLLAESRVKQVGNPAWSLELVQARKIVACLTKKLSYLRHGQDHSDQLLQEWQTCEAQTDLPTDLMSCSTALREAKARVKDIVAKSYAQRDEERQRRIQMLEASQAPADRKSAKRLRRLKKAEDIKQLFQKIKYSRKQLVRTGVTRIEIPKHPEDDPKSCSEWQQIDVPSEILRLLQERNKKHFRQALGTPFTVPPLSLELGFTGEGEAGEQILRHQYTQTAELNSNVKLLLDHLSYVHDMAEDDGRPTITDEEFCGKLRAWSESTTTSPSNLHLGHYKALIARHAFSTDAFDDELTVEFKAGRDELDTKQQELRQLHLQLLNYALERGVSYRRWQVVANTILFKDPDNVRLDRTRVIHIYEADYNLALGIKWRMAMYQAEDLKLLNEGQFGSRPHKNATDPVFCEEMQCEIARATRKSVILLNYDAKACYDRIVPNLAMLVSRKYGVPKTVAAANASTLEKAKYHIRTELGLAPDGYSHSPAEPIFGTGQGSANSPAIWCFLSCSLFDAYNQVATPATYTSPSSDTTVSLGLIGFVDDCNGQTNAFQENDPQKALEAALHQTTKNAQHWNDLLHTSGGALELSKCSCQVINWWFSTQGAPFLAPRDATQQANLQVTDQATGSVQTLELLSPYQAHKTLGHHKDPAGTQNEQFRKLKTKSHDLTSFLWQVPLSRLETWTFYYACYMPSITYPLACSSLTQQRLDQIQRKAMSIIIPRCGFNRHTKREILYGPLELGGASFRHLYLEQGVSQIQLFLRQWRTDSIAGRLLRIAVQWFQWQVGTSQSFLEKVHAVLPHLESKWLASLRSFLASAGFQLSLDNAGVAAVQRRFDVHIMDIILDSNQFTASEIKRLNYCRLFLQAQTLSDLAEVNGLRLDTTKLQGQVSLWSSVSSGPQIHQARPSASEWLLWKKANRLWSDADGSLKQALGPWTVPIHAQRQQHPAYQSTFYLWIRKSSEYIKCIPAPGWGIYQETSRSRTFKDLPAEAIPAHIVPHTGTEWKVIPEGCSSATLPVSIPGTFSLFMAQRPAWEQELLEHVFMEDDPFTVSWKLSFGVRGVSDGSVWFKQWGAFGWILASDTGDRVAECMGPAAGANPNSYRSEAYGMLSMLCFLRCLALYTGYHDTWTGVVASDNLGLVNIVGGIQQPDDDQATSDDADSPYHYLSPLIPEWDLVYNIRKILDTQSGLSFHHVLGHQDRHLPYRDLSLLSQLNVDADKKANNYQREYGETRPNVRLTESAGVHLISTTKGTITSKYPAAIRHQATYTPLWKVIQTRYGWSDHTMDAINWRAHGSCLRNRLDRKTHYIKLVHGILPTNHVLYRRDETRRKCPCCDAPDEDWYHIIHCPNERRHLWRMNLLKTLKLQCSKWGTRPELTTILLDGILGWLLEPSSAAPFELPKALYDDEFASLIHTQNEIGWNQVFLGRFAWAWSDLQDTYYATQNGPATKKKKSGQCWQTKVILFLWERWFQLWELRNSDVHGNDQASRARIEQRNTNGTLRELYSMRPHVEPSVQELFMRDIRDHENKPIWQIKHWLVMHEALIRASHRHVKKKAIQGMRSIRQYFTG